MKKNFFAFAGLLLLITAGFKQTVNLPLKEWNAAVDKPILFYISGDGGYTNFSENLCSTINKSGYKITALNSKSYFAYKKTPQQTTNDIVSYLNSQLSKQRTQQFILIGYSFGADIAPFVVNNFPDSIRKKMVSVVLLAPSTSTDFETHIWDMLGGKKKRSMDVVAEVNRLGAIKTAIITAGDEDDFPFNEIRLKNYSHEKLPGGHHFDGNTDEVAKTILKYSYH